MHVWKICLSLVNGCCVMPGKVAVRRPWIGHSINQLNCTMWLSKHTLITMTRPAGDEWKKTKTSLYKGPCLPVAAQWWLQSGQQPYSYNRNEMCCMFRGRCTSAWMSGLFMRCISARLADSFRICSQITRTLDANTFFCLLRFSGHCCVLTTGASQQLVMTQCPQSLKQFFLFFCAVEYAAASLQSFGRRLAILLWFNIS